MQRDILPIIKQSSENLLILGKAGVGKSTLIKVVKKHFGKKCVILCPTAIAAQNVSGVTIHSFFRLPIRESFSSNDIDECVRSLRAADNYQRLREIETIIIDEISMVNSFVFDAIDLILKSVFQTSKSFGGKRLILIGDIFQLPPIDKENLRRADIFFWRSSAYRNSRFVRLELRKVYRLTSSEDNKTFEKILEKLRVYNIVHSDIDFLNSHYTPNPNNNDTTTLCTRVSDVEYYNEEGLKSLGKRIFIFHAEISNGFPKKEYPVIPELKIAIGAPVIFIRNDADGYYKNGTRGKVIDIDNQNNKIKVRTEFQKEVSVGYVEWLPSKNNDTNLVQNPDFFRHFPLLLGYALTIHRCQGLTMSKVHLDLGRGTFAPGQLYVALSRLREISGLSLARNLRYNDLIQSEETLRFYNEVKFEEVNLNLSGAELSTVDSQNEVIKTVQGNKLDTKSLSVYLFNQGLNVEEILQERIRLGFREILPSTVIGHLVEKYKEVDLKELKDLLFITEEIEKEICEELSEIDDIKDYNWTEIRNSLSNPAFDWNKLKYIAYTNGFKSPPESRNARTIIPIENPIVAEHIDQINNHLFEKLKMLRNTLARERGLPAYCIFNNDTLKEMATVKPITKTQLLKISGVGEVKLNDFGDAFINCILENR
jgi:hypothetical protein